MNKEQNAEVEIAMLEAYCTEIGSTARLSAASTITETGVVMNMAAAGTAFATMATAVAIIEVVNLLLFEPSVRLARSSYRP